MANMPASENILVVLVALGWKYVSQGEGMIIMCVVYFKLTTANWIPQPDMSV